jgi:hypothetical protein
MKGTVGETVALEGCLEWTALVSTGGFIGHLDLERVGLICGVGLI